MSGDLTLLFERIRSLLDERDEPALSELEHTLTDGYARALSLEGESRRIAKEIGDLAREIDDPIQLVELRDLSERRTGAEADLERLRALLELLRRRVEARRRVAPTASLPSIL